MDSLWKEDVRLSTTGSPDSDRETDVCIIGAGIAGLSTAYALLKEGFRVVILDDGPIGGGETERTSAHLSNVPDRGFADVERVLGEKNLRLAVESHGAAIDYIECVRRKEKIDCDFERVDAYLFSHDRSVKRLEEEYDAAFRAGFPGVRWVDRAPLGYDTGKALRFPQQAQFHPLKYLRGLADAILHQGGEIFTDCHASRIEGGTPCLVESSRGRRITARAVVVATNSPVNDLLVPHTKQAAYRTYVLGFRVVRGAVSQGLFWDTDDPYHYVRLQRMDAHSDVLIVGGEDHKTGQADDAADRFARLERWTHERFPMTGVPEYRWSGQVLETLDGLAYIGALKHGKPNVYLATGDCGMGLTHGTLAAMILRDLIAARKNPWTELYDPSRKPWRAVTRFAEENLNVAAHYSGWLTEGDEKTAEAVAPGNGAILRKGLKKIAIYKDAEGRCHYLSAVCPHLGCIVDWNSAEKTWDCPCHGSRFECKGKVLNGPANKDLGPAEN